MSAGSCLLNLNSVALSGTNQSLILDVGGFTANNASVSSLKRLAQEVLVVNTKSGSAAVAATETTHSVRSPPLQLQSITCSSSMASRCWLTALPAATLTTLNFRLTTLEGDSTQHRSTVWHHQLPQQPAKLGAIEREERQLSDTGWMATSAASASSPSSSIWDLVV